MVSDFSKFLDNSVKEKLKEQLNIEPYIVKIAREGSERKEALLREVIPPLRAWLAAKFKWRWPIRAYHIQEEYKGEQLIFRVCKGKTILREVAFDRGPTVTFKRYSNSDPTE